MELINFQSNFQRTDLHQHLTFHPADSKLCRVSELHKIPSLKMMLSGDKMKVNSKMSHELKG